MEQISETMGEIENMLSARSTVRYEHLRVRSGTSRHPKAVAWKRKLNEVFDRIDAELEAAYGDRYPLHPARAGKGKTSNPEHDGLFNVGTAFSAGYGSRHGAGYVVRLRVATLAHVPKPVLEEIEDVVVERLREELPEVFPGRDLKVTRDGPVFRIHGNRSLGHRDSALVHVVVARRTQVCGGFVQAAQADVAASVIRLPRRQGDSTSLHTPEAFAGR